MILVPAHIQVIVITAIKNPPIGGFLIKEQSAMSKGGIPLRQGFVGQVHNT